MINHFRSAAFASFAAVLFGAAAWAGIALTRELEQVPIIWPGNGLLVALLLLRSRAEWPWMIAACFLVNVLVNRLAGDSIATSLGFSVSNAGEVIIAAYALRNHISNLSTLLSAATLRRFFGYAVALAPAASGIGAALVVRVANDNAPVDTLIRWWAADALGMAVMIPLVLAVHPRELRASMQGQPWLHVLGPFVLLILTTVLVFVQSSYPLLFLIVPALLLVAFRLGFGATAIAISLIAVTALAFTIAGHGPFMLIQQEIVAARIFSIQLLIGTLILTAYPVCAVIASQRRLLRDIASSEERFRVIAANSSDIITLTDKHGAWMYVSPSVIDMFGWSPEELRGQNGVAYVHPDDAELYSYGIKQLGSGRELLSGSFRMRRRDGRFVWVETISRSLKDAVTGEIVGWVSNTRDISARKRVEQIKDEFISTVSHELRTPLTAMLGSIGLAASGRFGAPDGQLKRLLDIADTNGQRLAQLVNDILDWEKVSSGKMRFECQPAAVDELVDQAIAATRPYAEKFDIALQARQRAPDVTISVDGNRFQQIMANLLSNAAKFSPSGSTVEIDASVAEGRCRISIIDHGYGIPADFRSNLFERFSRADSSDGSQRGGTGLGMAIARQMTEGMSGTITFESQENVGTTFHLYFPLSSSKANAA